MIFDATDALMGLAGGLLIGLGSALFLVGLGRIAGISGIAGGLIRMAPGWQVGLAFMIGLIGAPLVLAVMIAPPEIAVTLDPVLLVAGGLIVGFGTRLGGGCTSGHGVCGMSRFSVRSIVATLVFMAMGVVVASVLTPMLGS